MVQLFKNIFAFIGVKFQDLFREICVFAVNLQNFHPFFNTGIPFQWPLRAFSAFRTTLSYFDSLIYMCKYQSWFGVNQRCSALKIQCFRAKKIRTEQRWFRAVSLWNSAVQLWNSAVQLWNSADFFSYEQRWFRENQSWCLSCSLNQRWKTSKLWNSAVQLQPGSWIEPILSHTVYVSIRVRNLILHVWFDCTDGCIYFWPKFRRVLLASKFLFLFTSLITTWWYYFDSYESVFSNNLFKFPIN